MEHKEKIELFQLADTVYHWAFGMGVVNFKSAKGSVRVLFEGKQRVFSGKGCLAFEDVPTLSHKPYDLITGGFSQKRPKYNQLPVERGAIVFVRFSGCQNWEMRRYHSVDPVSGKIKCFQSQSSASGKTTDWDECQIKNPLM